MKTSAQASKEGQALQQMELALRDLSGPAIADVFINFVRIHKGMDEATTHDLANRMSRLADQKGRS